MTTADSTASAVAARDLDTRTVWEWIVTGEVVGDDVTEDRLRNRLCVGRGEHPAL
jgi:hypothetical protein